jgi:hypothetical protein
MNSLLSNNPNDFLLFSRKESYKEAVPARRICFWEHSIISEDDH